MDARKKILCSTLEELRAKLISTETALEQIYLLFDVKDELVCSCEHGFKQKNFDKCAICGGKWSTKKKTKTI